MAGGGSPETVPLPFSDFATALKDPSLVAYIAFFRRVGNFELCRQQRSKTAFPYPERKG